MDSWGYLGADEIFPVLLMENVMRSLIAFQLAFYDPTSQMEMQISHISGQCNLTSTQLPQPNDYKLSDTAKVKV